MLTAERLRERLHYDPETGAFTWRASPTGNIPAGSRAGRPNTDGYLQISIDNKRYMASRLAWLYMRGEWPPAEIDHINNDRADNRFAKLRLATHAQNCANRRVCRTKTVPLKGVRKAKLKWRADIRINGRMTYLGLFATAERANAAYAAAARAAHGEFARST